MILSSSAGVHYRTNTSSGLNETRGIHGLTCITTSPISGPLIYIDTPDNSLEDVTLAYVPSNGSPPAASLDGILIGSATGTNGAQSNVLTNITGSNLANVIHISSTQSSTSFCPPGTGSASTYNVCDLTILGVTGGGEQVTIKDDNPPAQV
jgi:hypothetical protein